MLRRVAKRLSGLLALTLVVAGCVVTSSIPTERQYVLAQRVDGRLAALASDDPLYDRFDDQVLSDAALRRLLMLFEHTTESFLATNGAIPAPRTVANHLVIVLDGETIGLQRDVRLATPGGQARVELALSLGQSGGIDLVVARHHMAAAMGPLLLELVGRRAPDGLSMATIATPEASVSPDVALWAGYALALEADYARPFLGDGPLDDPQHVLYPPPQDLLTRQRAIVARAEDGAPPVGEGASRQEAIGAPSAVAAFLVALQRQAGSYYPQEHMLWMVSYEPEEVPYGKVLLAMMRMRPGAASVEDLIASYADTYPAEREAVHELADVILGPAGGGD